MPALPAPVWSRNRVLKIHFYFLIKNIEQKETNYNVGDLGNLRQIYQMYLSVTNRGTNLFVGTFASPLVQVDVGLFQHDVGKTSADTFDGGHGEHDFAFAIDVGAEYTQDVLELFWDDQ